MRFQSFPQHIGADVTSRGKLFHRRLPATGNARSPTVESRVRHITAAWMTTTEDGDDWSRRHAGCSRTDIYGGAKKTQRRTAKITIRTKITFVFFIVQTITDAEAARSQHKRHKRCINDDLRQSQLQGFVASTHGPR